MAWLFALLRCLFPRDPVQQAVEGARHAVTALMQQVVNREALEHLKRDDAARAYIEAIINDYEAVVRLAIGMRACQIAGLRFNPAARHFHVPTRPNSLAYISRRLRALYELCKNIEPLAQALAIKLTRERDADPLAAHGSTDAALRAAAHHEAVGVASGLMVSSNLSLRDRLRPLTLRSRRKAASRRANHEAVLTALATTRGPPPTIVATHPQPALQAPPARSHPHAPSPDYACLIHVAVAESARYHPDSTRITSADNRPQNGDLPIPAVVTCHRA